MMNENQSDEYELFDDEVEVEVENTHANQLYDTNEVLLHFLEI